MLFKKMQTMCIVYCILQYKASYLKFYKDYALKVTKYGHILVCDVNAFIYHFSKQISESLNYLHWTVVEI